MNTLPRRDPRPFAKPDAVTHETEGAVVVVLCLDGVRVTLEADRVNDDAEERAHRIALAVAAHAMEDDDVRPVKGDLVPQLCGLGIKAEKKHTLKTLGKAVKAARKATP